MPLVKVRPPEGVFTKKQMHDVADRITDVTVVFEGSVSP
jgi:phenylpyruvate tautomerase PptA (4-oxalocrotonate tautomerase family)